MSAGGSVRAFVALEVPPSTREHITALLAPLRPRLPGMRWLSADTYHLTMRFLGPSPADSLGRLGATLRRLAAACSAADVPFTRLGAFPSRGAPRVLWLGLELPPALLGLQRDVERAAVESGFAPEPRPFEPHLTLGRWRDDGGSRAEARRLPMHPVSLPAVRLERLVLFRSDLRPQGAVHTPLVEAPLGSPLHPW